MDNVGYSLISTEHATILFQVVVDNERQYEWWTAGGSYSAPHNSSADFASVLQGLVRKSALNTPEGVIVQTPTGHE